MMPCLLSRLLPQTWLQMSQRQNNPAVLVLNVYILGLASRFLILQYRGLIVYETNLKLNVFRVADTSNANIFFLATGLISMTMKIKGE